MLPVNARNISHHPTHLKKSDCVDSTVCKQRLNPSLMRRSFELEASNDIFVLPNCKDVTWPCKEMTCSLHICAKSPFVSTSSTFLRNVFVIERDRTQCWQMSYEIVRSASSIMTLFCAGTAPGADIGPVISPAAKDRINSLIQSGIDEGAQVLLDGRNIKVKGYESGNFVGPTILTNVTVSPISRNTFVCLLSKFNV